MMLIRPAKTRRTRESRHDGPARRPHGRPRPCPRHGGNGRGDDDNIAADESTKDPLWAERIAAPMRPAGLRTPAAPDILHKRVIGAKLWATTISAEPIPPRNGEGDQPQAGGGAGQVWLRQHKARETRKISRPAPAPPPSSNEQVGIAPGNPWPCRGHGHLLIPLPVPAKVCTHLRIAPDLAPPLQGRGWGGGERSELLSHFSRDRIVIEWLSRLPHPNPSPKGEGLKRLTFHRKWRCVHRLAVPGRNKSGASSNLCPEFCHCYTNDAQNVNR